jgi:restriction endonuclease S subunit
MTKLASIAEIRMGATLRGRDATRSVPSGRFRLVRIGDISQDGTLQNDDFTRIELNESINEDLFLRSGDVLFPNRGNRTTAFAYRLDQPDTIVGAQFFILRPRTDRILPEYLAWFLRTDEAARYFDGRRKGTYVQIIQRSDLADMEIPLPPLAVQQKIAKLAELAVTERDLATRLANLKWKFTNAQLYRAAKNDAPNNLTESPE